MPSIEITAKTLDEARAQAADKLGADAASLKLTVIEESKGLFGKANVRVLVEVEDAPAAAPAKEKPVRAAKEKPARKEKPAPKAKATPAPTPAPAPEVEVAAPVAAEGEIEATQEDADRLLGLLRSLCDASGLECEVSMTGFQGRYVNLSLNGKDAGYFVGKNGEVLNSLQYLLNVIHNQVAGNGIRATLDGDDYRQHREEQLITLASRIAEQVEKRGEEAVLDALPAFERRIIHKALGEFGNVITYSEGEEPNRRVVIAPRD